MKTRPLLALVLFAGAAQADVVDLTRGGRRSESELGGFSVRGEFGNDYAPYGLVGAAISWVASTGTALEAGVGAGFPGVQLGGGVRQLFATGGTKRNPAGTVDALSTSRNPSGERPTCSQGSGRGAGPEMTPPFALKRLPWHGQANSSPRHCTVHPR